MREVIQRLLEWGRETSREAGAGVIVVDFRDSTSIEAAMIGVKSPFSALVADLIAMRLNGPIGSEVAATVINEDGGEGLEPASNHEVAKILSRITKRPVVYVDIPQNIARHSMQQLGVPESLIEGLLVSPRSLF